MNTTKAPPKSQLVDRPSNRYLIAAGILLGMGFAGFFDGIVLHQILQWHHMLTSVHPITSIADLELNTLWDGLFHISAFGLTAIGLVLLWKSRILAARESAAIASTSFPALLGAILIGAGAFNLIEGVIDHHILQIHHVKPGPHQLAWDLGFLALGALLLLSGWLILQTQRKLIATPQ